MTRRYPGKPQKMKVKPCPQVKAWIVHPPHLVDAELRAHKRWCPGWKGGVRAP